MWNIMLSNCYLAFKFNVWALMVKPQTYGNRIQPAERPSEQGLVGYWDRTLTSSLYILPIHLDWTPIQPPFTNCTLARIQYTVIIEKWYYEEECAWHNESNRFGSRFISQVCTNIRQDGWLDDLNPGNNLVNVWLLLRDHTQSFKSWVLIPNWSWCKSLQ